MNRIIVVVFNEVSQAFEGLEALKSLGRDDALMLHDYAIIQRQHDGNCMVTEEHN